jgi:hypothetical protein
MVLEGFNDDIVYLTGEGKVPNFLTDEYGNIMVTGIPYE